MLVFLASFTLAGCGAFARPLKPGASKIRFSPPLTQTNFTPDLAPTAELVQPENPALPSTQKIERTQELIEEPQATNAPHIRTHRTVEKIETSIGAAQKDTTREVGALISSMRPVQFVGILLVLASLAMFHPVVKAVTMSAQLQVVCGASGVGLIFLPTLVAANPLVFTFATIAGIAAPVIYHLAHSHGHAQGFIDANNDGIDDRQQGK